MTPASWAPWPASRAKFSSFRGLENPPYHDNPLPIGEGQTISQPYIVAMMAEAAELRPEDRVMEVGAGSGYAAAVFAGWQTKFLPSNVMPA